MNVYQLNAVHNRERDISMYSTYPCDCSVYTCDLWTYFDGLVDDSCDAASASLIKG
jgi:hypothetical protein